MFNRKPTEKTDLDKAIDKLHAEMSATYCGDKDYRVMVNQLVKLEALRDAQRPKRPSPDTLAIVAGNVLVTTVIVAYEQKAVVATKAKDFWLKLR